MKTKCYSVRLKDLVSISDKAFKAICFDGSTAIIPKSQVFGTDYDVQKCTAVWVSAWILEQKQIQYSDKKVAWFDEVGNLLPIYKVDKHFPDKMAPVKDNIITELKR